MPRPPPARVAASAFTPAKYEWIYAGAVQVALDLAVKFALSFSSAYEKLTMILVLVA